MNRSATRIAAIAAGLALTAAGCASLQSWDPVSKLAPRSYSADTKLKIARVQEQKGKLDKARELYSELYRGNPRNVEICQRLAVVSARMGETEQSERYFAEALRLDPNRAGLLTDYGYAKLMNNDYAGAEELLRRAAAISPGDKRAMNNLAIALGYQGKHEQSLATFRRVVPEAQAQANLAYIHSQRGEGRLAVQRYTRAVELDKNLKSASHALLQLAELEQRYLQSERGRRQVAQLKTKQSQQEVPTARTPGVLESPGVSPAAKTSDVKLVNATGAAPAPAKQADWTTTRPSRTATGPSVVPRKFATPSPTTATPVPAQPVKPTVNVEPRKAESRQIGSHRPSVTVPEKPAATEREIPVVLDKRPANPRPVEPRHRAAPESGPFAALSGRDSQSVTQPAATTAPASRWNPPNEDSRTATAASADAGILEPAPPGATGRQAASATQPPVRIRLNPAAGRAPTGRVRLTADE